MLSPVVLEKELPLASVDVPQFAVYSSTYLTVRPKVSFQGVAQFAAKPQKSGMTFCGITPGLLVSKYQVTINQRRIAETGLEREVS